MNTWKAFFKYWRLGSSHGYPFRLSSWLPLPCSSFPLPQGGCAVCSAASSSSSSPAQLQILVLAKLSSTTRIQRASVRASIVVRCIGKFYDWRAGSRNIQLAISGAGKWMLSEHDQRRPTVDGSIEMRLHYNRGLGSFEKIVLKTEFR